MLETLRNKIKLATITKLKSKWGAKKRRIIIKRNKKKEEDYPRTPSLCRRKVMLDGYDAEDVAWMNSQ